MCVSVCIFMYVYVNIQYTYIHMGMTWLLMAFEEQCMGKCCACMYVFYLEIMQKFSSSDACSHLIMRFVCS
jgi:hypothetical protein